MIKVACSTGIHSTQRLEIACRAIHELGFRYVDPLAIEGWHVKPSRLVVDAAGEAAHVREVLDTYGLACVAINLGFLHNFTTCTDAQHALNLQVVRAACTLADALGTSIITVGSGGMGDGDRDAIMDRVAARLAGVVALAGEAGATIALETHAGAISVYPDAARELLRRCPGLRLTYDPSHYIAERIPVVETLDLLPYAAHVHLRNARIGHFQERMLLGRLDMPWMVERILASGYQGAIAIEYIEDCGALQEGYETRGEIEALVRVLVDAGLML